MEHIRICRLRHFELESLQDTDHEIARKRLSDQRVAIFKTEIQLGPARNLGTYIRHGTADPAAGQFLDQQSGELCGIDSHIGIGSAFIAERGVCAQAMTAGSATHTRRIEPCALDEHICCLFRHSGVETAEDTGDTHRFVFVAYHQVGR